MPNKRAAHLKQVTLVIDKTLLGKVDRLAEQNEMSRNATLNKLILSVMNSNEIQRT